MKKMFLGVLFTLLVLSCSKDKESPKPIPSTGKQILSFELKTETESYKALIKNDSILATLPRNVDLTQLVPNIKISEKASITPNSGVKQDFSKVVTYKVTAEDQTTKTYKAFIQKEKLTGSEMLSFSVTLGTKTYKAYFLSTYVYIDLPYETDLTNLTPEIEISEGATISPAVGEAQDFSKPVKYVVTAENKTSTTYTVWTAKELRSGNEILSFTLSTNRIDNSNPLFQTPREYQGIIRNDSILITIAYKDPGKAAMIGKVELSPGAQIYPNPADGYNYDYPVFFEVSAENGSKRKYTVILKEGASYEKEITSFSITNLPQDKMQYAWKNKNSQNIDTLLVRVPYGTSAKGLTSNITVSRNATISPASGQTLDYTNPVKYTVTAEDKSTKEYLVAIETLPIEQVKVLEPLSPSYFLGKKGGEVFSFKTNILNLKKEKMRLELISYKDKSKQNLTIKNVNYETKQVDAVLPQSYKNGRYLMKFYVEENNYDEFFYGGTILLDSGIPVFEHIGTWNDTGGLSDNLTRLYLPIDALAPSIYIREEKINDYDFYLQKNGINYPVDKTKTRHRGDMFSFTMPLPEGATEEGLGFKFVIKYEGKEYAYPLVNRNGQPIEVVLGKVPKITFVTPKVKKGEELIVRGKNILYERKYGEFSEPQVYLKNSYYMLDRRFKLEKVGVDEYKAQVSMTTAAGTYRVFVFNNIEVGNKTYSGFDIEVAFPDPEHPTLRIKKAELVLDGAKYFSRQIIIEFNQNLSGATVKKIVILKDPSIVIDNLLAYPNSVTSGKLGNTEYDYLSQNYIEGYVVVEEAGKEYKLYFYLERVKE